MKKLVGVVLAAVVILIGSVWGVKQLLAQHTSPNLSSKEAIQIVEDRYPGHVTKAKLENEDGDWQYDLELEATRGLYKISVDAKTGKIIEIKQENKQDNTQADPEDLNSFGKPKITWNEAEKIARKQFQGRIKKIKLEREEGRLIYEIAMESESGKREAELEVDAHNGNVLLLSIEEDD